MQTVKRLFDDIARHYNSDLSVTGLKLYMVRVERLILNVISVIYFRMRF